jgi:predicted site-specific integrase-resolvase
MELLTPQKAAERLGFEPTTLQWWRTKGRGPRYVKIGRKVFYRPGDLDEFIAAGEREPSAA